jgi:hypothetical protein
MIWAYFKNEKRYNRKEGSEQRKCPRSRCHRKERKTKEEIWGRERELEEEEEEIKSMASHLACFV